ncbi:intermembrane transport protein PqiB [Marinobacter mobilis]|uniref:Paraquat-inducible protein B n=1 Tax=Marinobacter mobilis TaxID=488533 RepID=A0A1H2S7U4_9GAMM|nr:intermembrane transport protein PqiB [Marinobacter mobilis]SDW27598.1 paraquat-inducible protein B [Marinobacter mobilis]
MSDTPTTSPPPKLSAVWVIPLLAALIGAWLVYSNLSGKGPTITLTMENAEGITAGKTTVKTRNVQVGLVENVRLSEDLSHTLLTVQMQAGTERMLVEDTQFWIVKPRVDREGISGLSTVLSGAYIELLPGTGGKPPRAYAVSDVPPPQLTGDGLFLTLISDVGSSVDTGDPVNYRNLRVGRVVDTQFDPDEKVFRHQLFIEQPYDVLVTQTSRFWETSGLGFKLGAQGFEAQIGSLESLIGGGVSFAVPDPNMSLGPSAQDGDTFTLYPDQEAARRALYSQTLDYVLMVQGSVRGLRPGAPVEYRGVRVGTVETVAWGFGYEGPSSMQQNPVPVLIRLEPQRQAQRTEVSMSRWRTEIAAMVDGGLRASLQTGNLLTGGLIVTLDFHPDTAPATLEETYRSVPIFPTVDGSGISKIEDQVNTLLTTLNSLPFNDIANNLNHNLDAMTQAAESLDALVANPALNSLPQQAEKTLVALQEVLESWRGDQNSAAFREIQSTLQKLNQMIDRATPVLETLNERPNALIFQDSAAPDPQPRAQ